MPELPDVETFRRELRARALRRRVESVSVRAPRVLRGAPRTLRRRLIGRRLASTRRHGKFLFVALDEEGWLVLHFGMTGRFEAPSRSQGVPKHTRLLLELDDGAPIAYVCPRRLGRIDWTADIAGYVDRHGVGPDALAIRAGAFVERFYGSGGSVKSLLKDQKRIAGIGNVYSDEILFHARLHPETEVDRLGRGDLGRLHRAMHAVLRDAIRLRADPERVPGSWLLPHRRAGARCPRCRGALCRKRAAGRSAWLCPRCMEKR